MSNSRHNVGDSALYRIRLLSIPCLNRYKYPGCYPGSAQGPGPLEHKVVRIEVFQEESVTGRGMLGAHQAMSQSACPDFPGDRHQDDSEHQNADPQFPRCFPRLLSIDEVA